MSLLPSGSFSQAVIASHARIPACTLHRMYSNGTIAYHIINLCWALYSWDTSDLESFCSLDLRDPSYWSTSFWSLAYYHCYWRWLCIDSLHIAVSFLWMVLYSHPWSKCLWIFFQQLLRIIFEQLMTENVSADIKIIKGSFLSLFFFPCCCLREFVLATLTWIIWI